MKELGTTDEEEGDLAEAQRLTAEVLEHHAAGRYQQAVPIAQRALAIQERVHGSEHPETATAFNNLGVLYDVCGAYAKAEPLYQHALAIREKVLGSDHSDTAVSLNNLAVLYFAMGAYAKAEPLYQRALTIREKLFGPEHPDTALSLNNLAALYFEIGADAQAEPLFQRALFITEKALGPEHPDTAASLDSLAVLYRATGAYAEAERLSLRALAINEKALGPEHPDTANSLDNLAFLHDAAGAYTTAEPFFERALAIREKALGQEHPATAASLRNLAALYFATGDYTKSETLLKRALAACEKALGPEHPSTANVLNSLALLYRATGAHATAEPLYQRVLAIREKTLGLEHPDIANSLINLGTLYQVIGANSKAEAFFKRAQDIINRHTTHFLFSGNETRKLAYLQERRNNAYAETSFSLSVAGSGVEALGLTAVLQYKGRVLDVMTGSVALLRRSIDPKDKVLMDELAAVAQQFSALTFQAPGSIDAQVYRERLDALAREQERLERQLSSRSAAFRQALAPATVEEIRQRLPADAVLLECFRYLPFDPKGVFEKTRWGAPRYVAYVLRREGETAAIDLGAAQDIDKLVSDFRVALSARTACEEMAQDLFAKLIKPLQSFLPAGIDRLLLSPDGVLNLVPFAALIDEDGEFLAQRFELTYLTSSRDLLSLRPPATARSRPVVIADPDYGPNPTVPANMSLYRSTDLDRSGLVFKRLQGTAREAIALQGLLKLNAEDVHTGINATEEKLKELRGPSILHVATHGFFLQDQQAAPLRSFSPGVEKPQRPLGEKHPTPVLLGCFHVDR